MKPLVKVWPVMWFAVAIMFSLVACCVLTGCALQPAPPAPIQVRTVTVEVKVPTPVPCFEEKDRPVLPPPTPVDLLNGTASQLAAAIDADALADSIYTAAVDRLFLQCQKAGTP